MSTEPLQPYAVMVTQGMTDRAFSEHDPVDEDSDRTNKQAYLDSLKGKLAEVACEEAFTYLKMADDWRWDLVDRQETTIDVKCKMHSKGTHIDVRTRNRDNLQQDLADYFLVTELGSDSDCIYLIGYVTRDDVLTHGYQSPGAEYEGTIRVDLVDHLKSMDEFRRQIR